MLIKPRDPFGIHSIDSHTLFTVYPIISYLSFSCELLNLYSFTVIDAIVEEKFVVLYHVLGQGLYPSYSCDVTDFGRTHFGHYTNPTT